MKPNALWGGAFALLAAAIALGMVVILRQSAGVLPTDTPHTTVDYQTAYLPALKPLAALFALDQMFTVAYGAAFVGAALSWNRPAALSVFVIVAGLATAAVDTAENIRSVVALAGLETQAPTVRDLDLLSLLGALKWIGAGLTTLGIGVLIPRRGLYFTGVALFLGAGGVAALALGAVRLGLMGVLSNVEPDLAKLVIATMPAGLFLTGVALFSEARNAS